MSYYALLCCSGVLCHAVLLGFYVVLYYVGGL